MKPTKTELTQTALIHSIKRARQRYNLNLSTADINQLTQQIITNNAKLLKKISNTRSLWHVYYKKNKRNTKMLAMYHNQFKIILTFLTINTKIKKPAVRSNSKKLLFELLQVSTTRDCYKKVKDLLLRIKQLEEPKDD